MNKKMRIFWCIVIISLMVITSCASTTLNYVWRDENYSGHIKKVLVIGAAEKPGIRRIFEREFVNQLTANGVEAVPSFEHIPDEKMLDKDVIVSKINELDIDTVLISKLVDTKTVKRYVENWYSYSSGKYSRYAKDEIVNLETRLYDVSTEKLIWTALSETVLMEEESTYGKIKPFIKVVVNNLLKEKLFE